MSSVKITERMEVQPENLFYHENLARYRFAVSYLQPGWILDIATGTGYGAEWLSRNPNVRVVGADIHCPSLHKARFDFPQQRIDFAAASGYSLPFIDRCFRNIISLETIEHVVDGHSFLREIARVMHPDGICIISTPDREYSLRHNIENPFHVHEYYREELVSLLQTFFGVVELFHQGYSTSYHDQVGVYVKSIQDEKKKRLNKIVQLAINYIYHPIKQHVPVSLSNFFIRKLLKVNFPQPDNTDIIISRDPIKDASVFVLVCSKPRTYS